MREQPGKRPADPSGAQALPGRTPDEMSYDRLATALWRAPLTQLPALLEQLVRTAVAADVFAPPSSGSSADSGLVAFVRAAELAARNARDRIAPVRSGAGHD